MGFPVSKVGRGLDNLRRESSHDERSEGLSTTRTLVRGLGFRGKVLDKGPAGLNSVHEGLKVKVRSGGMTRGLRRGRQNRCRSEGTECTLRLIWTHFDFGEISEGD